MIRAFSKCAAFVGLLSLLAFAVSYHAVAQQVEISEFLASNSGGLSDEDGDNSDWIELHNAGSAAVDLAGWALTDDAGDPTKWVFPAVVLQPDAYLVVFASGKDRKTLGDTWDTVVRASDDWQYTTGNAPPSASWADPAYDDSGWSTGPGGFGYADGDDATIVPQGTEGVYIRRRFSVDDPADVLRGVLHVSWDDGFVAYLNGAEIVRVNCCTAPTAVDDAGPVAPFELADVSGLLTAGENVLAVEVRNTSASSSDLSIIPYLSLSFATPPSNPRGVASEVGPLGESNLHTNFSIARTGEYLSLADPSGVAASTFDPFPEQYGGISYGRNEGTYGYFNVPTPGAPNMGVVQSILDAPTLSIERGFFDAPFSLLMFAETPGSTIRYTTDGSAPTATHGSVYSEPLLIDRTSVIRAVATAPGAINSAPVTGTYIFPTDVIRQSANGAPPPGWPAQWGTNDTDYGMDPDVVNANPNAVIASLRSLPSFSIVTDRDHLFDAQTGIYANALGYGREWERPASIELLYPDGQEGFQINAGIRIRGGWSRNDPNPKHAFRFYFRDDYGPSKLEYPLFGDEGVDEFDVIDLRTSQNYSWAYANDSRNTMVRDVWARDTQREMGVPYTRSRYYHLYINGQYWGVFQTQERAEASYGESYLGGDKEEYDVVKSAGLADGYRVEATDGDLAAWQDLWEGANAIAQMTSESARTAEYLRLQGKNPDGTRNPAYEVLLDVDNLINYMLVIFYTGNFDAPISGFRGNAETNNFFSMRRRGGEQGFVHFAHDNEHTLLPEDPRYDDRTGPFPAGSQFQFSNPQWIHQQLMASEEYRLRFADLAHKHLLNDGVLTTARSVARVNQRAAEVQAAMLAESARWGDSKRPQPYGLSDWSTEVNRLRTSILPGRDAEIISQLRQATRWANGSPNSGLLQAPLYPSIAAPAFSTYGGEVAANYGLQISAASGEIFYTLDGSDPRALGGATSASATAYSGTITLQEPTVVSARVRTTTGWSPLVQASFFPGSSPAAQSLLAVSELNYHPADPSSEEVAAGYADAEDFEFVEIVNTSDRPVDLNGVRFSDGIEFTFSPTQLQPGQRGLVVSNTAAFSFRYGTDHLILGAYDGQLSNGGERVTLTTEAGEVLFDVMYGDGGGWPARADGGGSSLELQALDAQPSSSRSWRASIDYMGSPGAAGSAAPRGVVINEVLANMADRSQDAIELFNTTDAPVDLSGWYLSDSRDYHKFRIPDGTVLAAGSYLTFFEPEFNPADDSTGFSLNGDRSETLWLVETTPTGQPLGFSDEVHFPAARPGEAYGRWPNGSGGLFSMTAPSLDATNPGPRVGPVVIQEIMYEPPGNNENLEYLVLFNAGTEAEDLSHWSLGDAVEMTFPTGTTLAPGGSLVIVSFNPGAEPQKWAAFLDAYGFWSGAPLIGGWSGRLDNAGESVVLYRAGEPPASAPGTYPQVLEDRVTYSPVQPWPAEAAGGGSALYRVDALGFSEDPANWRADQKAVDVEEEETVLPTRAFALMPPYPNPTRDGATVALEIGRTQHVRVDVFDVLGRRVVRVHDGVLDGARTHRFEVKANGLASGLYLVRAVGDGFEDTASITVAR